MHASVVSRWAMSDQARLSATRTFSQARMLAILALPACQVLKVHLFFEIKLTAGVRHFT
jgi:hypothetical protein